MDFFNFLEYCFTFFLVGVLPFMLLSIPAYYLLYRRGLFSFGDVILFPYTYIVWIVLSLLPSTGLIKHVSKSITNGGAEPAMCSSIILLLVYTRLIPSLSNISIRTKLIIASVTAILVFYNTPILPE